MSAIKWDDLITALEKWRSEPSQNENGELPSVSTVAEYYKETSSAPWAILVSTIISLRTKDEVTLSASKRLLEKAETPQELLKLDNTTIEKLIYPAGFYKTKTVSMKKIAQILIDTYNGNVPSDLDALLELPGVGRKTANLVLIEAFDMDGICVDTHVHRISNRTGWVITKSPDETEFQLRIILPKVFWKRINAILVLYGQQICRPISPYCSKCVIQNHCKKNGVEKSR
jgi:endonuclease-3